jgi:hypothetical protein
MNNMYVHNSSSRLSPVEDSEENDDQENNNPFKKPSSNDDNDQQEEVCLGNVMLNGFETQLQQQEQKNDDDDDDEEAAEGRLIGSCKAWFWASQNDMRLLFCMAFGLKSPTDDRMIANWEGIPYINCKKINKQSFEPTKEQLWFEIKSSVNVLQISVPKIKSSSMDKEELASQ